ncbi:MAG: DUF4328 domain-containing protein [Bacteroidia bacterium]|jgi:hypothetical protein|nr:DUF4328 domain-containing protein [Bacteroidia bacterium]
MYYIKLHNNQKLHRFLRITLWFLIAAYLINVPVSLMSYKYISAIGTNPLAMRENMGIIIVSGIIGTFTGLLGWAFPILFLVWFYRAYENLQKINPALPSYAVGWSIGAWFVPILNFIRPFTMMSEIWNKTQRAMRADDEQYAHEPQPLLYLWWGTTLAGVTVAIVGVIITIGKTFERIAEIRHNRFVAPEEIMDDTLSTTIPINIITLIFYVAAMVLLSIILKKLSAIEEGLADRVNRSGFGQWGTPQQQQNWQQG